MLVDLWFADDKRRRAFNCATCPNNVKLERRCQENGFENTKREWSVDDKGLKVRFCPGKATWYGEIIDVFRECRVAFETGVLPRAGALEDQSDIFADVFPFFVERWSDRRFLKIRGEIVDFVSQVLTAIFGKKKGGG